ncbi:MAG TPA: hypothetical protein VFS99_05545 [Xanthomonadaceae bacterium]|nr:hypothetical protein [Xanthomonadaceae bacterium]
MKTNHVVALVVAILLAVAAIATAWSYRTPEKVDVTAARIGAGAADAATAEAADQPPPTAARPRQHAADPGRAAIAADRIEIGDRLWNPATQAEADWLNRHWYPTWEQAQLYNGTGGPSDLPPDLKARSAADIVLAEKVADTNRAYRDEALAVLQSAADNGSIYALQAFARVFEAEGGPGVQSAAYYRASVLRGDWAGGLASRAQLSPRERYVADVRAHQILMNLDRRRTAAGLPPLGRDVRTGLEGAIDALDQGGVGGG